MYQGGTRDQLETVYRRGFTHQVHNLLRANPIVIGQRLSCGTTLKWSGRLTNATNCMFDLKMMPFLAIARAIERIAAVPDPTQI